ncbi:MAG: outer membrane beta-barrel protein [Prosthecobacter sp.]|uniref:outer membrane beta-barrel protein n=1 Tax=Prosthecobacter sp. TaxID=1965333 RepID=UPI0039042674
MEFRAAFLLTISLTVSVLTSTGVGAVEPPVQKPVLPPIPAMLPPKSDDAITPLPNALRQIQQEPLLLLPPLNGEGAAVAVTRSASSRRAANPDVDPTVQLRRWQTVASAAGMQPYTWVSSGDVTARLALGVQSTFFYTDNLYFQTPGRTTGQAMFELSPIIKLDLGDPQGGISGAGSRQSEYYASLLYVPTFFYHLSEDIDDYAQHFLGEIGRVNEVSRSVLRVDYDERLLASSENTSPEENYTLLDASALTEYRITPLTTLRGKASRRSISLTRGTSGRETWIGEAGLVREISPKTKVGINAEVGHIMSEQRALGSQRYQQALISVDWKPTAKLGLTTYIGMEWREFTQVVPRGLMTSFVTNSALNWQATEKTRINLRLRVHNEPSVIAQGSLFRAVRFGSDLTHDFGVHYYTTMETTVTRRQYDSGRRDWEPTVRIVLGYRDDNDKLHNRTNIELFLQWHERLRNDIPNADVMRTQVGVQLTRYF